MKLIQIDSNVLHWADKNCLLAIQYKDKSVAVGIGLLPFFSSGISLRIMVPAKRVERGEYQYCGWGFCLVPALKGAVVQWPRWYRRLWDIGRWRNYDACGVLNTGGRS